MKPAHRSHAGWLELALYHPTVTITMRETLRTVVEYGTWQDKRGNLYAYLRQRMATRLGISERNVSARLKACRAAGWLVLCTRGQKGVQQTYHRSVPWDPVRFWTKTPCPRCGGRDPLFRVSSGITLNAPAEAPTDPAADLFRVSWDDTQYDTLNITPKEVPRIVTLWDLPARAQELFQVRFERQAVAA